MKSNRQKRERLKAQRIAEKEREIRYQMEESPFGRKRGQASYSPNKYGQFSNNSQNYGNALETSILQQNKSAVGAKPLHNPISKLLDYRKQKKVQERHNFNQQYIFQVENASLQDSQLKKQNYHQKYKSQLKKEQKGRGRAVVAGSQLDS